MRSMAVVLLIISIGMSITFNDIGITEDIFRNADEIVYRIYNSDTGELIWMESHRDIGTATAGDIHPGAIVPLPRIDDADYYLEIVIDGERYGERMPFTSISDIGEMVIMDYMGDYTDIPDDPGEIMDDPPMLTIQGPPPAVGDPGPTSILGDLIIGGDYLETPEARLDVVGQVRIRGGDPEAGRVLTSDADGNASWQELSDLGGVSKWGQNDDHIYNLNSGNVGIGTTTPTADLSFGGEEQRTIKVEDRREGDGRDLTIQAGNAYPLDDPLLSGGNLYLSSGSARNGSSIFFSTAGMGIRMALNRDGYLGIGHSFPTSARLQVHNTANSVALFQYNSGLGGIDDPYIINAMSGSDTIFFVEPSGRIRMPALQVDPVLGARPKFVMITTDGELIEVSHTGSAGILWRKGTGDHEDDIYNLNDGNVGIGTTEPGAMLEVDGDALIHGLTVGLGGGSVADNTAIGVRALNSNTTNLRSTAVGYEAIRYANSSADGRSQYNTAVGYQTLRGSTTPGNNTGRWNTAVGDQTLMSYTSGSHNTAMGASAMQNNTSGQHNTAIGHQALQRNVANDGSTAIGYRAMQYADNRTTGRLTANTAIGYEALVGNNIDASLNWGRFNTAVGYRALHTNRNADGNTGVGYEVMHLNQHGVYNSAFGYHALRKLNPPSSAPQGFYNVAIGYQALDSVTTGYGNTAIGYDAGRAVISANNTISIGYQPLMPSPYGGNWARIGNGSITSIGGMQDWTAFSDSSAKHNVSDYNVGLEFIRELRPVSYNFKEPHTQDILYNGFIAQDIEYLIKKQGITFSGLDKLDDPDAPLGLRYAAFVVPLVNATKELVERLEKVENKSETIDQLRIRNAELQAEIDRLKALEARIEALENN